MGMYIDTLAGNDTSFTFIKSIAIGRGEEFYLGGRHCDVKQMICVVEVLNRDQAITFHENGRL
jgi:hypothetical protein